MDYIKSKMNKKFIIITINLLLIFIVFIAIDFFSYFLLKKIYLADYTKYKFLKFYPNIDVYENALARFDGSHTEKFKVYNFESKDNKSILVFGCSMIYGMGLKKDSETFSYKLSKILNKTVYNLGWPGGG